MAKEHVRDYKDSAAQLKACYLKKAEEYFKAGEWMKTTAMLDKIDGYDKSSDMYMECRYQLAQAQFVGGYYENAVSRFSELGDYKDSRQMTNESMYLYATHNMLNTNSKTYSYLKTLKEIGYKDAAANYDRLFAWKVKSVFSTSEYSTTFNRTSISKYSPLYCHITVEGGPPSGTLDLTYTITFPTGEVQTDRFSDLTKGGNPCWYFEDSIYVNPLYGQTGTLSVVYYDQDGNQVGTASVKITD